MTMSVSHRRPFLTQEKPCALLFMLEEILQKYKIKYIMCNACKVELAFYKKN